MSNRFADDEGGGVRGNTADFTATASDSERGGTGSDGQKGPHSSRGFRRALMRTQRGQSGTLKGDIADRSSFGGDGFKKPNYFAQGGKRHGMHIGAGAPHTAAAEPEGADA